MEVVETVLPWLGTLCHVVTLLVIVETGDMTQVFESPIGSAGNVGGIDLVGWDRTKVVSSPLVFIESSCQQFEWDGVRIECGSRGVPSRRHSN